MFYSIFPEMYIIHDHTTRKAINIISNDSLLKKFKS